MNGQIAYTIETVAATVAHVKSGRLKRSGMSFRPALRRDARRAARSPRRPACPGSTSAPWIGYSLRPGRRARCSRAFREIQKAMQAQDLRSVTLPWAGPVANTPDEMMAFLRTEQARYGEIVRKANIQVE